MIVTVTLNPSLDRAIDIERLMRGQVIRAAHARLDPGGKGVNVSRALLANGVPSQALLPTGGDEGQQLVRLLRAEGVDLVAVPVAGNTRSNVTLAEPDGTVTKINEPGPTLSLDEFDAITKQALAMATGADWVVVSGSLPPGLAEEDFGHLCESLVGAGVSVAVDTSGPGLRAAAKAGVRLLKPNRDELAEVAGGPWARRRRRRRGPGAAVMGRRRGAGQPRRRGCRARRRRRCPQRTLAVDRPRSSVGAGDALLAGFLAAGRPGALPWLTRSPGAPQRSAFRAAGCRDRTTSSNTQHRSICRIGPGCCLSR